MKRIYLLDGSGSMLDESTNFYRTIPNRKDIAVMIYSGESKVIKNFNKNKQPLPYRSDATDILPSIREIIGYHKLSNEPFELVIFSDLLDISGDHVITDSLRSMLTYDVNICIVVPDLSPNTRLLSRIRNTLPSIKIFKWRTNTEDYIDSAEEIIFEDIKE